MGGGNMGGMTGGSMPAPMGGNSMGGGSMGVSAMGGGAMNDMPRGGISGGYSTSTVTGPSQGGYGGGGPMSRAGLSDSPQMGGGRAPASDSIIIRNLPLDCNWQVLREGFSHCGDIKYAEMKERGTGLIRFANERDAERSICKLKNILNNILKKH